MNTRADTEVDTTLTTSETEEFIDLFGELFDGEGDPFEHVNSLTPLAARAHAFVLSIHAAAMVRSRGSLTTCGILMSHDTAANAVTFNASDADNDFSMLKCRLITALGGPDQDDYDALVWHEVWADVDVDDRAPMIHSLLETTRGD